MQRGGRGNEVVGAFESDAFGGDKDQPSNFFRERNKGNKHITNAFSLRNQNVSTEQFQRGLLHFRHADTTGNKQVYVFLCASSFSFSHTWLRVKAVNEYARPETQSIQHKHSQENTLYDHKSHSFVGVTKLSCSLFCPSLVLTLCLSDLTIPRPRVPVTTLLQ